MLQVRYLQENWFLTLGVIASKCLERDAVCRSRGPRRKK
jgi:hypothetical protein